MNIQLTPGQCRELLEKAGICFLFAQKYHSAMKYVGGIRKELGIRTVFNILGPITNPAHPTRMVLGVYDEYLVKPLAKVLIGLGVKHGVVIYGQDKLDEISVSAPTTVCEFHAPNGADSAEYKDYVIQPEDFGFKRAKKEDIVGGTPQENAQDTLDILSGKKGPKYDIVMMNAGTALYVGGKAASIKEGVELAERLVADGSALKQVEAFKRESNK